MPDIPHRAVVIAAWVVMLAIAFATLSPIGLRPITPFGPTAERFAAFVVAGALFAVAYPRHFALVALLVVGTAALLELLQLFVPTRHGQERDLLVKIAGAAFGLVAGKLFALLAARQHGETRG